VIFISVALRLPITNGRANVEPSVAMKIDGAKLLTRRDFLGGMAGTAICALTPIAALAALSRDDHAFLEDLSRRSFQFFWEHTDPDTGLTRGREDRRITLRGDAPRHWQHRRNRVLSRRIVHRVRAQMGETRGGAHACT
jgi:hypothetical protein